MQSDVMAKWLLIASQALVATLSNPKVCSSVVAIDIDHVKVELAMNNAMVYGVDDRVDFIIGDFVQLAPSLKVICFFLSLSPPWGGPMYKLFQIAQSIMPNIIMFLQRNVGLSQLEELAWLSSPPLNLEAKENCVGDKLKAIKAYFS
ncbi:unnamed protein product [Brassica rapa subsp. narinosa]|uniref:Trimethylguanosine synthase n=1 Tax=Brassica napus TaxID=3708 RepID=A0A816P5C8_BRANA|nr:unnamed protein product [Brassica napus]